MHEERQGAAQILIGAWERGRGEDVSPAYFVAHFFLWAVVSFFVITQLTPYLCDLLGQTTSFESATTTQAVPHEGLLQGARRC